VRTRPPARISGRSAPGASRTLMPPSATWSPAHSAAPGSRTSPTPAATTAATTSAYSRSTDICKRLSLSRRKLHGGRCVACRCPEAGRIVSASSIANRAWRGSPVEILDDVILDGFVRALDGFEAVLAGVAPDRWDAPSPCESWCAVDVAGHVIGELRAVEAYATGHDVIDSPALAWSARNASWPRTPTT
jgi:hypothetical protein